jgi:DNA-binding transcriptional MerR regulator
MEWLRSALVERSSDAIAVLRLEDEVIVDVNEAFSRLAGFRQEELLGREAFDLFIYVGPTSWAVTLDALRGYSVIDAVPAGFQTRSRELRVGYLSALILEVDGRHHALCVLRGDREPVFWEQWMAVRVKLARLLQGGASSDATVRALQALGEYLHWELTALWRPEPFKRSLRCAAVWRSPSVKWAWPMESSHEATIAHGGNVLRSVWLSRRPAWTPDVSREHGFPRAPETDGDRVRGCFAFPIVADDRVLGVVQLLSRESREPESDLLDMADELGRLLGRHVQDSGNQEAHAAMARVDAGTSASPPSDGPLLHELAETVGRLESLLGSIVDRTQDDRSAGAPTEQMAPTELRRQPPVGVTLKTVSQRTGVPAATLRTWERRYRVLRPRRSANGYRLYEEDDITRILKVINLLRRGVQVSDAMAAVAEPASSPSEARLPSTGHLPEMQRGSSAPPPATERTVPRQVQSGSS